VVVRPPRRGSPGGGPAGRPRAAPAGDVCLASSPGGRGAGSRAAQADDRPTILKLLAAHLGNLDDLEVIDESWPSYDHANVQVGLDSWLAKSGRDHTLVGFPRSASAASGSGT
jgi:hypothetical protein